MEEKVTNKMLFFILITIIGLIISFVSFMYAIDNPITYNGIKGIIGSLLGRNLFVPFIIGTIVMFTGLILCFIETYGKK